MFLHHFRGVEIQARKLGEEILEWLREAQHLLQLSEAELAAMEKLDLEELTCREAVKEIARIIHTVHDEAKDKPFELEMSWVCDETGKRHERVPQSLVREADEAAKRALEEADMSD